MIDVCISEARLQWGINSLIEVCAQQSEYIEIILIDLAGLIIFMDMAK